MKVVKKYDNDNNDYELHVLIYEDLSFSLQLKTKDGKISVKTSGKVHKDVLKDDFKFEDDDNIGIIKNNYGGFFYAMNRLHPYNGVSENVSENYYYCIIN